MPADRLIFLFEDNPDRLAPMLGVLAGRLPNHRVVVFQDAGPAIAWFAEHQPFVELVSLDFDMDGVGCDPPPPVDPGDGRAVAEFVASREPT